MIQFCSSEQRKHLGVAKNFGQALVLHLGEGRVHHQDQADGDGHIGRAGLEPVDEGFDTRDEVANRNPDRHGQEDPQGEEAIQG